MAKSTKSDVIIPEAWDKVIQGAFAGKTAFLRSPLVASGAAVVMDDMPAGPREVGAEIKVPYFGVLGDFEDLTDGNALTPKKISETQELATVAHAGIAFEATQWAQSSVGANVFDEGKRQMQESGTRKMDAALVTAAAAAGALEYDVSATSTKLDYDVMVDGVYQLGDEASDGIAAAIIHSKVKAHLLKLKDGAGRPLLTLAQNEADFDRFVGIPLIVTDRAVTTGSTMSAVTAAGTSPPTVTLSGTPNGSTSRILIDIVVGGAVATATFRFSTDGGQNWSATMATAASVPLTDTAIDSLVGANGATGITAAFGAGTYNADNTFTATTNYKHTTLVVKRNSLAFWFNRSLMRLQTDRDILTDSDVAAIHMYHAAHRYRRPRGSSKPGVVKIVHV
jgi:hypothetical protein